MSLEFRVIPHRIDPASFSLAIDSTLLYTMNSQLAEGKEVKPIFRTYQFSNPVVIMGCNQKIDGRFNAQLASRMGVQLTRRNTGGGHMYYSPEDIHFSIIAPIDFFGNRDLLKNYQDANSFALKSLQKIGYNAVLGKTSIRISGEKEKLVAGTAQRRLSNAFLHQAGILVSQYDSKIFDLLMAREDEIVSWKDKVVSLKEYSDNYAKIPETIVSQLPNYYVEDLNSKELSHAVSLVNESYNNPDFILAGVFDQDICLISGEKSNKNRIMEAVA